MVMLLVFAIVALSVVAVAAVCHAIFAPRLRAGGASYGRASAVTLLALLITPAVAAIAAVAVLAPPSPAAAGTPVGYGITMYFYAGYAVGLVCFLVLNRRFRRISGER